jgi:hypothetical protein
VRDAIGKRGRRSHPDDTSGAGFGHPRRLRTSRRGLRRNDLDLGSNQSLDQTERLLAENLVAQILTPVEMTGSHAVDLHRDFAEFPAIRQRSPQSELDGVRDTLLEVVPLLQQHQLHGRRCEDEDVLGQVADDRLP